MIRGFSFIQPFHFVDVERERDNAEIIALYKKYPYEKRIAVVALEYRN